MKTNDLCKCANCPGQGCQCGCQAAASDAKRTQAPDRCACGPACACKPGECACG